MCAKFKEWLNKLYQELTAANETPHRVAISFALGVFLGILPFTGVLAAIALAWALKLNKAAAILGSAITNTWLGLIVLGFAVKLGAWMTGIDWHQMQQNIDGVIKNFSWEAVSQANIVPLLLSVMLGYVVVSLLFALFGYILARVTIKWHKPT